MGVARKKRDVSRYQVRLVPPLVDELWEATALG